MTYREWERYERERLASRNGVANDLRTRVSELEAENNQLRGLLSELVEVSPVVFKYPYKKCIVCGAEGLHNDRAVVHADDCAWWNAVQAMGSE